jgi:hypothetical protein
MAKHKGMKIKLRVLSIMVNRTRSRSQDETSEILKEAKPLEEFI